MLLMDANFCLQTANIWHLLGWVVFIFKIVIPLILIVLGMVDLGKAVVSSDDKAMNKAVGSLIKRFIAAVIIFFVPTIVSAVFNVLGIFTDDNAKADYNVCIQCVTTRCSNASSYAQNQDWTKVGGIDNYATNFNKEGYAK